MAAIAWVDVVAFAPLLSTVAEDAQVDILAYVNQAIDTSLFGGESSPMLRMARIFLAAHFGSMPGQSSTGAVGPVTSESAGGLSRSYAQTVATGSSSFESTTYGQQYVELCKRTAARAGDLL